MPPTLLKCSLFFFKSFHFTKLRLGCENQSTLYLPITPLPWEGTLCSLCQQYCARQTRASSLWLSHSPHRWHCWRRAINPGEGLLCPSREGTLPGASLILWQRPNSVLHLGYLIASPTRASCVQHNSQWNCAFCKDSSNSLALRNSLVLQ